jgi:CO/xanthine dehydrogenase Mo-binding subunit
MKPGPHQWKRRTNIITHFEGDSRNVEEGFAQSDVIVENTYRVPFVDHAYLEPESGVAWIDETELLPFGCQLRSLSTRGIAEVLKRPTTECG